MEKDALGICLSRDMLSEHLLSTFTHVRAYEVDEQVDEQVRVLFAFPQMSGRDVLTSMQGTRKLIWRADFFCPHFPSL